MGPLIFTISGLPKGKGRPKFNTRGAFPRAYTPEQTRKYEAAVKRLAVVKMAGHPPLIGGVSLSLRFRLPIAKSLPKARRASMIAGEVPHTQKPDFDNLVKAIVDAFNKVVWLDDAQVCRAWIVKEYADAPGIDVRVEALEPQASPVSA